MISLEEFKNTVLKNNVEYQDKLTKILEKKFSGDKLLYAKRLITEKSPSLFVDEDFAK